MFNFWCDTCLRHVDSGCVECDFFKDSVYSRFIQLGFALEHLKDVFDDCEDVSDLKTKVRLNMASAFDTALDCFDDCLNMDLDEFINEYDPDNLPDQFSIDFF